MRKHEPLNILMVDDQPDKLLTYEVILSESATFGKAEGLKKVECSHFHSARLFGYQNRAAEKTLGRILRQKSQFFLVLAAKA